MSNITNIIFSLPNIQLVRSVLPSSIYDSLMSEIKEMKEKGSPNEHNSKLAGAIEQEYTLSKMNHENLSPFLKNMATEYWFDTNDPRLKYDDIDWDIAPMWVNLQKKNEYNPLHNHSGDISFVIWMEIPYKSLDESNQKNIIKSNNIDRAACFEFTYQNISGDMRYYRFPVEKGWEGRVIMFPSNLMHQVYPFQTSDDYRISISGNLHLAKYPGSEHNKYEKIKQIQR